MNAEDRKQWKEALVEALKTADPWLLQLALVKTGGELRVKRHTGGIVEGFRATIYFYLQDKDGNERPHLCEGGVQEKFEDALCGCALWAVRTLDENPK